MIPVRTTDNTLSTLFSFKGSGGAQAKATTLEEETVTQSSKMTVPVVLLSLLMQETVATPRMLAMLTYRRPFPTLLGVSCNLLIFTDSRCASNL